MIADKWPPLPSPSSVVRIRGPQKIQRFTRLSRTSSPDCPGMDSSVPVAGLGTYFRDRIGLSFSSARYENSERHLLCIVLEFTKIVIRRLDKNHRGKTAGGMQWLSRADRFWRAWLHARFAPSPRRPRKATTGGMRMPRSEVSTILPIGHVRSAVNNRRSISKAPSRPRFTLRFCLGSRKHSRA
jgi:hypothetical protein